MSTDQKGSTTLVVAALVAVLTMAAVAVGAVAMLYAARAQAQNASDAAALAAAVGTYPPASSLGPVEAARRVAALNRAEVAVCRCPVDGSLASRTVEVTTVVVVDTPIFGEVEVRGSSRAEFDPARWLGLPGEG